MMSTPAPNILLLKLALPIMLVFGGRITLILKCIMVPNILSKLKLNANLNRM